jgi:general secretion pathway protein G
LGQNLFVLRATIEQFTLDKEQAPTSLDELVSEGYLRVIPADITGSNDTWQPEYSDLLISPEQSGTGISDVRSGSSAIATDGQSGTGISDVRSGSSAIATDGTPYSTW